MNAARIEITEQDSGIFQVTVQSKTTTTHTVTLRDADYQSLAGGKATPEKLIEKSFGFLLERESNTSILSLRPSGDRALFSRTRKNHCQATDVLNGAKQLDRLERFERRRTEPSDARTHSRSSALRTTPVVFYKHSLHCISSIKPISGEFGGQLSA